jgi:hypothetical protein
MWDRLRALFRDRSDTVRRERLRLLWLPIIRQRADTYQCQLSPGVADKLLAYVEQATAERQPNAAIREQIDNHIRIGLAQPQCWVKLLIA